MFCTSFIDFVNDAGLTQFVTTPTRGDHVLDMLPNDAYILSDYWVESPLGFNSIRSKSSDHNTVHFNIHCGADCDDFVYRNYANADFIALNNYLLSIDWQSVLVNSNDVNVYWNNFMCIMNIAIEMYVPLKHTKSYLVNGSVDTCTLSDKCLERDMQPGGLIVDLKPTNIMRSMLSLTQNINRLSVTL